MHLLHAFGGGFTHDDVAHGVDTAGYFVLFSPFHQEITDDFFVFGGTRTFGQSIEVAPQFFGFKVFDCHNQVVFIC
jgi:hypothetical protein